MRAMTGQPRVIIASRLFAPEVGAAAFRLNALVEGLRDSGCQVSVLTTTLPAGMGELAERSRVSISRFPVLRDRAGYVRGYLQYLSFDVPMFFRLLFTRGAAVVAEPPPTTGAVVAITSWLLRRPFAYYAADVWADAVAATSAPRLVVRLMKVVEGFALRRAAVDLAVSEDVAERTRTLGTTRVEVVGNGIDTDTFSLQGPGVDAAQPTFVYTGTMSEWQGADVFIRAFPAVLARYPEAELHFFGQGSHERSLRTLAEQTAPDHIHFHGVIAPAETARWLRAATAALVSIVPGKGYDFAKPTKVYAAAACGAPVVFAGTGAGAQLVADEGLGASVEFDATSVAEAMLGSVTDQQDGTRIELGPTRSRWANEHASLKARGSAAAAAVVRVAASGQALDSQQ